MMWKTLRRAAAGWMIRLADSLHPTPSEPLPPTLAELTPLPFEAVWARLITALRACQVSRVDLAVYRQNDRSTEYRWSDPEAHASAHCSWSLGVSFPRADGRRCELQATSSGGAASDHLAMLSLRRILDIFAMRFAIHVDRTAGLTVLRVDDETSAVAAEYLEEAA